jgi:UTP--glucose-1-phosphate uridylyltransferase
MIRKAIIPAAGFGTRFLPATKSQPKEMLPIVDRPVIQYVIEELANSGVRDALMVIGRGKRAIEEHFDHSFQLEMQLKEKGKLKELELIQRISNLADIHFVWQKQMLGLGHAVYCGRHHVGKEPFLVLLGDTVIDSPEPACKKLIDVQARLGGSAVLVERVAPEKVSRYGIVDAEEIEPGVFKINDLIEKPDPDEAPSNLAIASRYAFTSDIFGCLEQIKPGKGGELQLTDAMRLLVKKQPMYAVEMEGQRCDIGNKLGFVKTNLDFALRDPELSGDLKAYILQLANSLK